MGEIAHGEGGDRERSGRECRDSWGDIRVRRSHIGNGPGGADRQDTMLCVSSAILGKR